MVLSRFFRKILQGRRLLLAAVSVEAELQRLPPSTPVVIKGSGRGEQYTPNEQLQIDAINKAIDEFAAVMREKMIANVRKKNGWRTIPIEQMWAYAQQEIAELRLAMDYEDARAAQKECADVGNFMMMLFHKLPSEGTKAERARRELKERSRV